MVSVGTGYLAGVANQHAVNSVSTSTVTSFSTTPGPGFGTNSTATTPSLQLVAAVSPASVTVGQNVTIVAEVFNPLPTNLTISATEMANPSQYPCGLGIFPTGIRVYSGHYTLANLSAAAPLQLYNASGGPPACFVLFSSVYTFLPDSDEAKVSYLGTSTTYVANQTIVLMGYWTQQLPATGPLPVFVLQSFEPGAYTVLVFDSWGQRLIEYFQVT